MFEHMTNWDLVHKNMAGLTPKGIDSTYIHEGIPQDMMLIIEGNRNDITLPMSFYPYYLVAVYGF